MKHLAKLYKYHSNNQMHPIQFQNSYLYVYIGLDVKIFDIRIQQPYLCHHRRRYYINMFLYFIIIDILTKSHLPLGYRGYWQVCNIYIIYPNIYIIYTLTMLIIDLKLRQWFYVIIIS